MKRIIRLCSVLALLCVLGLCISSCSLGIPPSKKTITSDLVKVDEYLSSGALSPSITINKRQTRTAEGVDCIWLSLTAENDITTYRAEYYLTYILYNDGWQLEEWDRSRITIRPKEDYKLNEEDVALHIKDFDGLIYDDPDAKFLVNIEESCPYDPTTKYADAEVTFTAEMYVYKAEYHLEYYWDIEEGWMFEWIQKGTDRVTPLMNNSRQVADEYMQANYQNYSIVEEFSTDTMYTYEVIRKEGYVKFTDLVVIDCDFSIHDLWTASHYTTQKNSKIEWDIVGMWCDTSGDDYIYINILSIDDETVTLEYEMRYTDYGTWDYNGSKKSNGVETVKWRWDQKGNKNVTEPYTMDIILNSKGDSIYVYGNRGVSWLGTPLTLTDSLPEYTPTTPGIQNTTKQPTSALDLMNTVWNAYDNDQKFFSMGGNYAVENNPGVCNVYDEFMNYALMVPSDQISYLTGAASLVHAMNSNTFTGAAYQLKQGYDVNSFAAAMQKSIKNTSWYCGTPDKLIIIAVGEEFIVVVYGVDAAVDPFCANLSSAYPNAKILVEENIGQ